MATNIVERALSGIMAKLRRRSWDNSEKIKLSNTDTSKSISPTSTRSDVSKHSKRNSFNDLKSKRQKCSERTVLSVSNQTSFVLLEEAIQTEPHVLKVRCSHTNEETIGEYRTIIEEINLASPKMSHATYVISVYEDVGTQIDEHLLAPICKSYDKIIRAVNTSKVENTSQNEKIDLRNSSVPKFMGVISKRSYSKCSFDSLFDGVLDSKDDIRKEEKNIYFETDKKSDEMVKGMQTTSTANASNITLECLNNLDKILGIKEMVFIDELNIKSKTQLKAMPSSFENASTVLSHSLAKGDRRRPKSADECLKEHTFPMVKKQRSRSPNKQQNGMKQVYNNKICQERYQKKFKQSNKNLYPFHSNKVKPSNLFGERPNIDVRSRNKSPLKPSKKYNNKRTRVEAAKNCDPQDKLSTITPSKQKKSKENHFKNQFLNALIAEELKSLVIKKVTKDIIEDKANAQVVIQDKNNKMSSGSFSTDQKLGALIQKNREQLDRIKNLLNTDNFKTNLSNSQYNIKN